MGWIPASDSAASGAAEAAAEHMGLSLSLASDDAVVGAGGDHLMRRLAEERRARGRRLEERERDKIARPVLPIARRRLGRRNGSPRELSSSSSRLSAVDGDGKISRVDNVRVRVSLRFILGLT